jgi:polygalacturonase
MLMTRKLIVFGSLIIAILWNTQLSAQEVSPNDFQGSDTERIQAAIRAASGISDKVVIPASNSNGTGIWRIDSAILIPSNMTVILDNCTLQLSDRSRDNLFRSDNVGATITDPKWNKNISIIGIGQVLLKGANNPRSTGDGARKLTLDPEQEVKNGTWRVSYGSDAGKEGEKQTGDWRNIMILMAFVDGFTLRNVALENSHCWAISFERVHNAELTDLRINNPEELEINGKTVAVSNKDGIDLRQGCKNFHINNISGYTGDDFIALSNLGSNASEPRPHGGTRSTMVTASTWFGTEDDIEQIVITNINCTNRFRGVAIRASDQAGIHHVYIDGLIFKGIDDRYEALMLGGKGYGKPSLPGKINNIYAMNLIGNGECLIRLEAAVANCHFVNGIYTGPGTLPLLYDIDKKSVQQVTATNIVVAQ